MLVLDSGILNFVYGWYINNFKKQPDFLISVGWFFDFDVTSSSGF
jgi:hypothetical protein